MPRENNTDTDTHTGTHARETEHMELARAINVCKRRMFDLSREGMPLADAAKVFFDELAPRFNRIVGADDPAIKPKAAKEKAVTPNESETHGSMTQAELEALHIHASHLIQDGRVFLSLRTEIADALPPVTRFLNGVASDVSIDDLNKLLPLIKMADAIIAQDANDTDTEERARRGGGFPRLDESDIQYICKSLGENSTGPQCTGWYIQLLYHVLSLACENWTDAEIAVMEISSQLYRADAQAFESGLAALLRESRAALRRDAEVR